MVKQISLDLDLHTNQLTHANPIFARHETFHPRFGWLKKGFDAAVEESQVFLREDAPVRLGVGKNMASSIRYWCNAFKVLEDDLSARQHGRSSYSTDFGTKLLGNQGWDAYLEDPATLWLLHWNLLKPPCNAAAWYFTFNIFRSVEFSVEDLTRELGDYRDKIAPRIADSSVKKDISCLLRMYVEQSSRESISEDSIDCPFAELGIIQPAGDSQRYVFRVGAKANLPAEVVVAACLEFASSVGEQKTISISRLTFDPGSPGLAFKLSESAVCEAIEQVERWSNGIRISDSAGLIQFSFSREPLVLAEDILDKYYRARRGGVSR